MLRPPLLARVCTPPPTLPPSTVAVLGGGGAANAGPHCLRLGPSCGTCWGSRLGRGWNKSLGARKRGPQRGELKRPEKVWVCWGLFSPRGLEGRRRGSGCAWHAAPQSRGLRWPRAQASAGRRELENLVLIRGEASGRPFLSEAQLSKLTDGHGQKILEKSILEINFVPITRPADDWRVCCEQLGGFFRTGSGLHLSCLSPVCLPEIGRAGRKKADTRHTHTASVSASAGRDGSSVRHKREGKKQNKTPNPPKSTSSSQV